MFTILRMLFLLGKGGDSWHEEGKGHWLRKVSYVPATQVDAALDGTGFACAAACMWRTGER